MHAGEARPQVDSSTRRQWSTLASLISDTTIDEVALLNNTNPNAKQEFMSDNSLEIPHNEYGNIDQDQLLRNLETLEQARYLLDAMNLPGKLGRMAACIIDDLEKRNRFVLLCDEFVHGKGNASAIVTRHRHINGELYGVPDERTYLALLSNQLDVIRMRELDASERREFDELVILLDENTACAQQPYHPPQDAISFAESAAHELFDSFLDCIPKGKDVFEVSEACEIAQRVLADVLGQGETGWHAEVSPTRSFAATDHTTKTVWLPGRRSTGAYSLHNLRAILVHEIGVHVLRALPYEGHPILALSRGLPGYLPFEEGVAKMFEQSVNGKYGESGMVHYISIGLAFLRGKKFREVYDIQVRICRLTKDLCPERCFDSVQRAFRGTSVLPNNKDLAYFDGSTKAWRNLERHLHDPLVLDDLFLSGKSDITNNLHRGFVYEARMGSI